MTKENRIVEKVDLVDSKTYEQNRTQLRKNLVQFKKKDECH